MPPAKRAKTVGDTTTFPSQVKTHHHPVIQHKLTQLRRTETSAKHFRELLSELTLILGIEATRDLLVEDAVVDTPSVSGVKGQILSQRVALVPIMRGGLGLVDPMLTILPNATVYHIGIYNNPESLLPVLYFNKLPLVCEVDVVMVLDAQIGSGATLVATIDLVKEWAGENSKVKIKVLSVLASQRGVDKLEETHPDIELHVAAVDKAFESGLPDPGLGDPGSRMFNAD